MSDCIHPYRRRLAPDAVLCLACGRIVTQRPVQKEDAPVRMPPVIYDLTYRLWNEIRPWKLIPFKVPQQYGWYISMLKGVRYLVMPIFDKDQPVFYSARRLEDSTTAPKYMTHPGRAKRLWQSGKLGDIVLCAEGIADAAYLSLIAPSVALLGSYGEITPYITPNRRFLLLMDGDEAGIKAAFRIVQKLKKAGHVKSNVVILPPGADPTDYPVSTLKKMIRAHTGVVI